jgi:hypothetical protein
MRRLRLIWWLLVPSPLLACKCQMSLSVCHEFAVSGAVFIGTVESVTPAFLDRWNPAQRPSLPQLNEAEARYHQDPSPASLGALKDTFRKIFPDLPPDYQQRLQAAGTPAQLNSLFDSVLNHGKQVRFLVRTVFRGGDDDDDKADPKKDGKKDDDQDGKQAAGKKDGDKPRFFDVYTPFGDCGYDFQQGETYLVYADDDEETNILETSRCSRTNRVTDAGADLAYLYFLQNSAEASGRFEGFVTTNPYYQVEIDHLHDPEKISSPVSGAVLELQSGGRARYAATDPDGRFVFDGLATGEYQVAAYESGYPEDVRLLQGPARVRIDTKSCANRIILAPPAVVGH